MHLKFNSLDYHFNWVLGKNYQICHNKTKGMNWWKVFLMKQLSISISHLYDKMLNKTYLIFGIIASTSKSLSAVCLFLLFPCGCAQFLNRNSKDAKQLLTSEETQKFKNRWANVLSRLNIFNFILLSNPFTAAWLLQSTLTLYDSLNVYVSFCSTTGVCVGAAEKKNIKN